MTIDMKDNYNWVSDIIRTENSSGNIKDTFISPQVIENDNQYKEHLDNWMTALETEF